MVVHDVQTPGGMERVHTELIRRAASHIEFVVVSTTLSEELRPLVEWRRVPVIRRPIPIKLVLFFIGAAIQIRRARADLVHTAGAIVPNHVDLASVHFCHAGFRQITGSLAGPSLSPVRRLNSAIGRVLALIAERWCYRPGRTELLAPVSASVARQLDRHYPRVPMVVIANAVDSDRFVPARVARRDVRQRMGAGDQDIVALFVGGWWDLKGLSIAIEALALARRRGLKGLRLWVLGRGDERRYRSLMTRWGINGCVEFLGVRKNVAEFYQAADIFLLPSRYEAFPLVTLEAAASGLPLVVAPTVGGMDELLGADEAGLVAERTAEAFATALEKLAADPSLRSRLGQGARRRARSMTWERSVKSVLDLYEQLLSRKNPAVT